MRLPSFWSTINDCQPEHQVEELLRRSKQGLLRITFVEHDRATDLCEVVSQNAHRVEHLVSCSQRRQTANHRLLAHLEDTANGRSGSILSFPKLTFLDMWYSHSLQDDTLFTLNAPRLQVLNIKNVVPRLISPSLERLTFEVSPYTLNLNHHPWSAQPFLRMAADLPSLQVLDLRIVAPSVRSGPFNETVVSAVKMRFIIDCVDVSNLKRLLRSLTFPRLDNLTLHLVSNSSHEVLSAMHPSRFPRLRRVKTVLLGGTRRSRGEGTFAVLQCFPQVHDLIISGASFDEPWPVVNFRPNLASLRTLVFTTCFFDGSSLQPLLEYLMERPDGELDQVVFVDRFLDSMGVPCQDTSHLRAVLGERLVTMSDRQWFRDLRNRWL